MYFISVIIPVYNEVNRLENAVNRVATILKDISKKYQIIIAEDGSTDGTDILASNLAKNNKRIIHIHSDKRLGRGRSIENAVKFAKSRIIAYIDVDLEAKPEFLKSLVKAVTEENYDIAIGSRFAKGCKVKRSFLRTLLSVIYNNLVRIILKSKIKDHQCGLKVFKRDVLKRIMKYTSDNHWFWDTETLVLSQILGYKIKEVPIVWIEEKRDSKVKILKDSINMFINVFKLNKRIKTQFSSRCS